jgi:hypothetical protein
MKLLEIVGGVLLGAVTLVFLGVNSLLAFGSMGRYRKMTRM